MPSDKQTKKSNLVPIAIIAGLFAIFGFVTWINGALIPFMKTINELTEAESYLVASASYISFVLMALPASSIISKVGYRKGMSLGLIIMAVGALVFIPAAEARTYWVFLAAIFIQGVGMTICQTAANPYITILGPMESGAKRIAMMGIANKLAGALGSIIFGALLLSGIDEVNEKLSSVSPDEKAVLLDTMADSVFVPYIVMAIMLLLFGISLGIPTADAKFFTMFTLLAMVFTYAVGIVLIPKYIKQGTALRISALLGIAFSFCILYTTGFTSVLFVAALGISNALVWPAIWPLTLDGLGKFTKTASALLIMAISGGAIIPPLYGRLVDATKEDLIVSGVDVVEATATAATGSYWILIPCYAMILFFSIWGHKYKSWGRNK